MIVDTRRSPRIALRQPLRIRYGNATIYAESVTVNAHGALVHCPRPIIMGANIVVHNQRTGETVKAWVVFVREADRSDHHAIGIEFLPSAPEFWGASYHL